jgi:hypothetical protein
MTTAVIDVLRRFLPPHVREHRRAVSPVQRRAVWAINKAAGSRHPWVLTKPFERHPPRPPTRDSRGGH